MASGRAGGWKGGVVEVGEERQANKLGLQLEFIAEV
jgi:hypothetical protein